MSKTLLSAGGRNDSKYGYALKLQKQNEILSASPPLKEKVYEILKEQILNVSFPPGVRIYEDDLAASMQLSRTPVNWAIARLIQEGLLKRVPRRGVYVTEITKEEINDVLIVREALEGMAARLATKNLNDHIIRKLRVIFQEFCPENLETRRDAYTKADTTFHNLVIETSGCEEITKMMTTIQDRVNIYRLMTSGLGGRTKVSLQEHLEIIEALERKDPDLAETLMRRHIKKVRERTIIKNAIESSPERSFP